MYNLSFRFYILNINGKTSSDDETGPNDARRIVWAIGEFFSFLSSFSVINYCIISFLVFTYEIRSENDSNNETGPNDASGIVWAHFVIAAHFSIDISYVKPKR